MIQERQFLNFIPPRLDGDVIEDKRRYMVVAKNNFNKTIDMINISKISGKNNRILLKDYNVIIDDYKPLSLPSFAKTNTIYRIEYFKELDNYISFGGKKLKQDEFANIIDKSKEYIEKHKGINIIKFTKEEFLSKNPLEVNNL